MNWIKKHKFLTIVLVIIAIVVLANLGGGNKTNTASTTGTTDNTTSTAPAPAEPAAEKVSLDAFYAGINNGMTKAEVNALSGGREPSSCSESQSEYIGKMETCNYGGFTDRGMVMVTYTNDKVTTKNITKF